VFLQGLAVGMLGHAQTYLAALSSNCADNRRTIILIGAVPFLFIGTWSRGIGRIAVFFAFFPPHSETSHLFQSPHRVVGYSVGGESHSRGAVDGGDGRYHKPGAIHAISSPWTHLYRFHATTESLGLGGAASLQTEYLYRPCMLSDSADSDTS